jgi:hypothetical protein
MTQDNYLSRKNQVMKTFDKLLARVKPSVISWLGEEQASQLWKRLEAIRAILESGRAIQV